MILVEHGAHVMALGLFLIWVMWRSRFSLRLTALPLLILVVFFAMEVGVFTSHHVSADHGQRPCCVPSLPVFSLAFTVAAPRPVVAEVIGWYDGEYIGPVVASPSNKSPPMG